MLSLGSWVTFSKQVDQQLAQQLMAHAYDNGVNFFDNAEVYAQGEAEILMGQALKHARWGAIRIVYPRRCFGVAKNQQRGLSKKHVHDACHAALKRLQVDYLDLFFCHRPTKHAGYEQCCYERFNCSEKILRHIEWKPNQ